MTTPLILTHIQVPDRELHARYFAGGLTKYGYNDIFLTLQEMDQLEKEADILIERASALVRPYDQYPGDIFFAPESVQKVNELTTSDRWPSHLCEGNIKGGGRQEKWPVEKWQRQMASLRRAVTRLRKTVEICERETLQVG